MISSSDRRATDFRKSVTHVGKRRNGYAIVSVLVFLAVMLTFIGLSQRELTSILMVERAQMEEDEADDGPVEALARGIELLETGLPPSDPYTCRVTIPTAQGMRDFRVHYWKKSGDKWWVEVDPLVSGFLPPMPPTFNDSY